MILKIDFIQFLKELEKNNNKQWFEANKKRFEESCKIPFYNLANILTVSLHTIDKHIVSNAKQAVFRIHRDIRFSKNKKPYKTNMGAAFTYTGKKESSPSYYVHIDSEYCMLGGGAYFTDKKDLELIRKRIVSHTNKFRQIIQHKDFIREFNEIQGEKNKIVPTHFKEAAKDCDLIRNKQFYVMKKIPITEFIDQANQVAKILETLSLCKALNSFIYEALRAEK